MVDNSLRLDAMGREVVEPAVVGGSVDPPEAGAAKIADARAELVAQEPEQAEHAVGVGSRIRHNLAGVERGLLA